MYFVHKLRNYGLYLCFSKCRPSFSKHQENVALFNLVFESQHDVVRSFHRKKILNRRCIQSESADSRICGYLRIDESDPLFLFSSYVLLCWEASVGISAKKSEYKKSYRKCSDKIQVLH